MPIALPEFEHYYIRKHPAAKQLGMYPLYVTVKKKKKKNGKHDSFHCTWQHQKVYKWNIMQYGLFYIGWLSLV